MSIGLLLFDHNFAEDINMSIGLRVFNHASAEYLSIFTGLLRIATLPLRIKTCPLVDS